MKKSTIWLLTIIMGITFAGLLYMQISYMRNMVKMRDDQFSEGVKRSLYAVSTELEQDEAKYYLEEDVATVRSQLLPSYSPDGNSSVGAITYSFTTGEGLEGDITLKGNLSTLSPQLSNLSIKDRQRSMQEVLRGQYIYQRTLLNEVILNIISHSGSRPLKERADSATVATYLKAELANNGLSLPFEFAVVNRMGAVIYRSAGYRAAQENAVFSQTLFPSDSPSRMNYLRVYFPTMNDYIFSSVRFMIPTFVFTFILLVTFIYTIAISFRQKKLTEMKNDFINNMTHEFKTPISTISLAAQMLHDGAVLKSPKMLEHISTVINDETRRLRFQVDKVLQMSMFERQGVTFKITEVDANAVIDNVVHTFKIKVEKYGGNISTHLDADDPIVNVDEMHFTNVIFNLLDNAVKYRREEEPLHLDIHTRNIDNGRRLQITVADNGIGIRKEELKKIFDKFYRVSTGNRHDVKGFGLGLAYVQRITRQLGGQISVESELGQGTKFIITLPTTA
ncbi:MAG: HAMP domain-containing histidine kinase [Pseudoflavonifractor sp.]|nr:HAMP domain-containing histidine kinase [Alloprevotella sp.]MCM1117332.1 HAMP domain-containing histidine kinase [Pseudoflavonifractor sp.]